MEFVEVRATEIKQAAARRNLVLAAAATERRIAALPKWHCATCKIEAPGTVHQLRKTYCSQACMVDGYKQRMLGSANPNYRDLPDRACGVCHKPYQTYQKAQKYCSRKCYFASKRKAKVAASQPQIKQPRAKLQLSDFDLSSKDERYRARKAGFDVPKLSPPKLMRACVRCHKEFRTYPSQSRRYCSYACHIASGGAFRAGMAAAAERKTRSMYGHKKDANHVQLADALKKMGVPFLDLSMIGNGCPDGLALINGDCLLVEIKNPKTGYGRRGLNPLQKKWADQWRGGAVYILKCLEDVEKFGNGRLSEVESYKCGAAWELS